MPSMRFPAWAAVLVFLVLALMGCGGGGSGAAGSGGSGGGGGSSSFQPRPLPGDFFAVPPVAKTGLPRSVISSPGNVVYDAALKEFFFSNPSMSEVEAYSSTDGHRVGAVTVPGAMGLSVSPDGSQLAVGTDTPHVYLVDAATLHVTRRIAIPASVLDPGRQLEPVWPFLMATGPMLIDAVAPYRTVDGTGTLLSYDPASGTFATMNPPGANVGVYGAVPARSLDGKYLAVPTLGQTSLQMAVYSAATQTYIVATPGQYSITSVAASPDGTQFVTTGVPSFGGGSYITFWSRSMQQEAQYATKAANVVYSRDGKYLYVHGDPTDVIALNASTGLPAGYAGFSVPTNESIPIYDSDGSNHLYGLSEQGAFAENLGDLQPTAPAEPQFSLRATGNPNEGALSGGTEVQFVPIPSGTGSADGIDSTMEAYFGSAPATKDVVAPSTSGSGGENIITATAPANSRGGPVTVVLADANDNVTFLPDAYSYGPHAISITPSALSPTGGTVSDIVADGIFAGPLAINVPQVSIGGNPAGPGGGGLNNVTVSSPAGNPGWADLTMTLGNGTSETTKNMVQYLAEDVTLPSAAYTSAVYDPSRDRFYLTGADNTVGVFDPETQSLLQPMTSSAISSGAVLGSLAITPDESKLLVSDPTDDSVVVFDLANGASSAVHLILPSATTTLSGPIPIAAVSGNRALVLLTSLTTDKVQEIDLTQMTARVRTDVQNNTFYSLTPLALTASADGSVALLSGEGSAFAVWKYDAASDTFSEPFIEPYGGLYLAANDDGSVLGLGTSILGQNLLPLVPIGAVSGHTVLTGSGGLWYGVSGDVQISDTHNGRLLLTVGSLSSAATALAIDPDGRKILVCSGTSLHYYELAVVPLAVATVSPANAAPGATLTVRGNGFVAGTTVTIGGQSASCTMVDQQTLQCGLPNVNAGLEPMKLSNPDGQTYSLEAAVNVQ